MVIVGWVCGDSVLGDIICVFWMPSENPLEN